jgi:hypothetical protein
VRPQWRHFRISLDFENDWPLGGERFIAGRANRVRAIQVNAFEADQLAKAMIC